MNDLDPHYASLLKWGLLALRDAIRAGDLPRALAEVQNLHEVPSLIGDDNLHRHLDYMQRIRMDFVRWVKAHGDPSMASFVESRYRPIWEAIMTRLLKEAGTSDRSGQEVSPEGAASIIAQGDGPRSGTNPG